MRWGGQPTRGLAAAIPGIERTLSFCDRTRGDGTRREADVSPRISCDPWAWLCVSQCPTVCHPVCHPVCIIGG
jgi:hypothetical protein